MEDQEWNAKLHQMISIAYGIKDVAQAAIIAPQAQPDLVLALSKMVTSLRLLVDVLKSPTA